MSGVERCDEIVRLIDAALAEQERAEPPWQRATTVGRSTTSGYDRAAPVRSTQ